jgi:signal transduction histidine kinase
VVTGLAELHTDLQELSRGMHPAVLSRGGLRPALRALARRSPVPVELDLRVEGRLPESVEVAAYYVIAEALTNTAKYAAAQVVTVCLYVEDGVLHLSVADDGIGGAQPGGGSGLIGLQDRVEALSGRFAVTSAPGAGTTLRATIPVRTS